MAAKSKLERSKARLIQKRSKRLARDIAKTVTSLHTLLKTKVNTKALEGLAIKTPFELFERDCSFKSTTNSDFIFLVDPDFVSVTNPNFLVGVSIGCRSCVNNRTLRMLWEQGHGLNYYSTLLMENVGHNNCHEPFTFVIPSLHSIEWLNLEKTIGRVTIQTDQQAQILYNIFILVLKQLSKKSPRLQNKLANFYLVDAPPRAIFNFNPHQERIEIDDNTRTALRLAMDQLAHGNDVPPWLVEAQNPHEEPPEEDFDPHEEEEFDNMLGPDNEEEPF